jgi:hypothetical protein
LPDFSRPDILRFFAVVLVLLAALMAIEAVVLLLRGGSRPDRGGEVELASA